MAPTVSRSTPGLHTHTWLLTPHLILALRYEFDQIDGVVSSSVGYTGGTTGNPDYKTVCRGDGHTEAIKIEFDPAVISYEEIMHLVLPQAAAGGKVQYMSAVWALDGEQEKVAKKVAAGMGKAAIPILPAGAWHDAEEYHQKYVEKQRGAPRSSKCGGRAG